MPDLFVHSFIEKLILLESRVGAKISYRILPPLTQPLNDYIEIQNAANQIADFIGLSGLTFVVSFAKQADKVGGHIDLKSSSADVFIEIDSDARKFPEAVAATLCHEICHKWLQINGISSSIEIDNEILTDITSVFLGLGKIMLNGCLCVTTHTETGTNETVEETRKIGYLDRDQLAFVYRTVCSMRNIPSAEYLRDLNTASINAIRSCDSLYGRYYDLRFHEPGSIRESGDNLEKEISDVQFELSKLDKYLTYIKKSFNNTIYNFLNNKHKQIQSIRLKSEEMTNIRESDPALNFLQTVRSEWNHQQMMSELRGFIPESYTHLEHAEEIGQHISSKSKLFPLPNPEMFNTVNCYQCGTTLRLPEGPKKLIISCPTCKYRFSYDAKPLTYDRPLSTKKFRWIHKCLAIFRRQSRS
jgi:hypothetical protein